MPRGKGIYEDEPRDQLENAEAERDGGDDERAKTDGVQEPPD